MPDDLPIYSEKMLRTGLQFADLAKLKGRDLTEACTNADAGIGQMSGVVNAAGARAAQRDFSKESLLRVHGTLFDGRDGAGQLRTVALQPRYRGQDCAPPEFIDRSLDNLAAWLAADSFKEIHPIEKCALTIARIVDIWPFESGNLAAAIVFANLSLLEDGLAPFFVLPEHQPEFQRVIANAMTIDMQPLINAVYKTVKREMEILAKR